MIELTSAKIRYEDRGEKRAHYADLGVREYYLFNPLGEFLMPPLRAYELVDNELASIAETRFASRLLQRGLCPKGR
ncbi:MAG: Uma2 family endonuclease [Chloroflexaceae bacterium]|nr:Uma2 family endonuclease [Chloroflexaceae bacterium]